MVYIQVHSMNGYVLTVTHVAPWRPQIDAFLSRCAPSLLRTSLSIIFAARGKFLPKPGWGSGRSGLGVTSNACNLMSITVCLGALKSDGLMSLTKNC